MASDHDGAVKQSKVNFDTLNHTADMPTFHGLVGACPQGKTELLIKIFAVVE